MLCIGCLPKAKKSIVSGCLETGTARASLSADPEGIENDAETGATKKTPEKGAQRAAGRVSFRRVLTETHSAWRLFFPKPPVTHAGGNLALP